MFLATHGQRAHAPPGQGVAGGCLCPSSHSRSRPIGRFGIVSDLAEDILAAEADPTLADLLWWKGDRVAVMEIAVQVNGEDVRRAVQRTKTLQQGGAQAMAMVIGESWAMPDTRERARTFGIDWKVSADL